MLHNVCFLAESVPLRAYEEALGYYFHFTYQIQELGAGGLMIF